MGLEVIGLNMIMLTVSLVNGLQGVADDVANLSLL